MESTITGTVGQIQGKPTKAGTVWEVEIGGKRVNTWKEPMAQEVRLYEGSTVEATIDTTENKNGYPKNTILAVKLVDAAPGVPAVVAVQQPASAIPVSTAPSGGMSPEREQKIVRQSSMATAFNYAASAGLSEDEAFALAGRIYARAMGEKQPEPVGAAVSPSESVDDTPW